MAVVSAIVKPGTWSGSFKDGRIRYTLTVETNDPGDGPSIVKSSNLVPMQGDTYRLGNEVRDDFICVNVDPKSLEEDSCLWEVAVEFEQISLEGVGEGEDEKEIFSAKFSVSTSVAEEKRPMLYDLDGKPIRNSARERFSNPVEESIRILILNISQTEYKNPISKQISFSNKVNKNTIWGVSPGYILMKPIIVDFDAVRTREQFLTDGFKIKY